MTHDFIAVKLTTTGWWLMAAERFTFNTLLSAILAFIVWLVNRKVFVWLEFPNKNLPSRTAYITFISLVIASAIGAIYFGYFKPYM